MEPAIRTVSLTREFGAVRAVDGLDLEVPEGELFGLVGPDGAGKTTVMRLLTGILRPNGGEAQVAGVDVVRDPERVKESIGYMSQRFGLYPDLTVSENIRFYADIYGVPRKALAERTERLLAFSNLGPFRKRFAGNLSGGMKQKLGLVCALIHTPKILFLDEPTNGVDPVSRRDFWSILYRLLKDRVTLFVSTAYLDEAERCNRVGLLHEGRLVACGAPEEVKTLMEETILEVTASAPRAIAKALRRAFGREAVGLFGDRVHVVCREPGTDAKSVREHLAREGLEVLEVREVAPSLEDVFISVLEKRGGGAGD